MHAPRAPSSPSPRPPHRHAWPPAPTQGAGLICTTHCDLARCRDGDLVERSSHFLQHANMSSWADHQANCLCPRWLCLSSTAHSSPTFFLFFPHVPRRLVLRHTLPISASRPPSRPAFRRSSPLVLPSPVRTGSDPPRGRLEACKHMLPSTEHHIHIGRARDSKPYRTPPRVFPPSVRKSGIA